MHLKNIKFPIFIWKILKLHLFCFPMLVALCFHELFLYKIPMHRKWVRLKCSLNLLLDALFYFNFIFLMWASSQTIKPNLKALKKSTCWEITQEFSWVLEVINSVMTSPYPFCLLFVPRMTSNERELRFGELLSQNRFLCSTVKIREKSVRFPTFNKVAIPVFTMLVPRSIASIHS